ncbi:unnamed protein product [marine sediment metagenome]|uniref:Uncharacterized protein n=1 Tax=marine sediment metagenome TaxID=412755 RepID=X1PYU6_9ZZZZ
MKKQKNYDKKVKQTRIILADYLLLKSLAQNAGVSMSEALHKIITRDWAMAHKDKPVTKPTFIAKVKAPVALRIRSQPILTTNGHKAGVFVTKPKGGIIQ